VTRKVRSTATATAAVALSLILVAHGQAASEAKLTPVAIDVLDRPNPVRAADDRHHLAYELRIANLSDSDVEIKRIQPRAEGRRFGPPLEDQALGDRVLLDGGEVGTTLAAGQGATVFMDVAYRNRAHAPRRLRHRFELAVSDPATGDVREESFGGVATTVDRREPVELAPPLSGNNWLVGSGCCTRNAHRSATLAIDGTLYVPERFAIDFVQLDAGDRMFTGPVDKLSSFRYFGSPVRAAAPGRVVRVQDGLPEQVPGELPSGQTIQTAGGNYAVVRIGRGRYAFYAHLQPNSITVEKGKRVRVGERIGLLGNTGNTDAPHLHFHVMDSPSPLRSSGLPFTFDRFRGQGVVTDRAPLFEGEPAVIDREALAGPHRNRLPRDDQLVEFG
jgi:hypothetical protein